MVAATPRPLSSLRAGLPRRPVKLFTPVKVSIPGAGVRAAPCRAVLVWIRQAASVHSAPQGRRGLTSPRQRLAGGPIREQEEEAPRGRRAFLYRCTSEEKERKRGV